MMNNFFSAEINVQPFHIFSACHVVTLAILTILNILIVVWLEKRKAEKSVDYFRYILSSFLLLSEISSILWCVMEGVFTLDYALPVQLCDAAAFLSVIMLIRGHKTSFELVYFWGLGGSLQALITPDLYYPFPHFMFFNFFFLHGAIITAVLYMIAAKGYKLSLKSIGKTFVFTNLYAGLIAIVNLVTGGNYMYLRHKPEGASIIDFLGPWPWYILSLEAVLLVTSLILYIPFAVKGSHNIIMSRKVSASK